MGTDKVQLHFIHPCTRLLKPLVILNLGLNLGEELWILCSFLRTENIKKKIVSEILDNFTSLIVVLPTSPVACSSANLAFNSYDPTTIKLIALKIEKFDPVLLPNDQLSHNKATYNDLAL